MSRPFLLAALRTTLCAIAAVCAGSAQAAKPNQAPSVAITAPATNSTFGVGATVNFTATASDADGSVVKVEYLVGGSTLLGSATTAPYALPANFPTTGSYSITARATDNIGATKTSVPVVVNIVAPPTVAMTSPANGASFTAPATIPLGATASDTDGTIAKVEFLVGSTVLATDTAAPYAFSWTNVPVGSYLLSARATDNSGAVTTSTPVTVTVGNANQAPLVVLTAPDSCLVYDEPATIVLQADAVDRDGRVVRVDFLQGATVVGSSTATPYLATWTNIPAGTYSLTARATDDRGGAAMSVPVSVVVRTANQPPSVTVTAPLDGAVYNAPAPIAMAASATDADGTVARVDFVVDGTVVASSPPPSFQSTWVGPSVGAHTVIARATDNRGATRDSAPVRFTVNAPPTVQVTSPAAGASFVAPATIRVTATATAMAGSIVKLEYFDNGALVGTTAVNASTVSGSFDYLNVPAGLHALQVKATDAAGLWTLSAPRDVTVDAVPIVMLTAPAVGAKFGAPAQIDLVADASVSFGAIAKVEFFAGATQIATVTTRPYTARWANVPAGTYALTAKATTSSGLTAASSAVQIGVNSVNLTVDSPQSGITLFESSTVVKGSFANVTVNALTINGIAAKLGSRSFAAVIPLQAGANSLAVVADTSAGTVTRTLTVTREEPRVEITNVSNGQTIHDDRVTLVGKAYAPDNSAVLVNGYAATKAPDGTFFVNDLPLAEGANRIEVVLNTNERAAQSTVVSNRSRQLAKSTIVPDLTLDLDRNGQAPFVLELDVVEGFAPLVVTLRLTNRSAYVYDDLALDTDGDGHAEYVERGLPYPILERQFQVTYTQPGVFYPTITLTRLGSEIVFKSSKAVHVHTVNGRADAFKAVYQNMLDRLAAGDIPGASTVIGTPIRAAAVETFNWLGADLAAAIEQARDVREALMSQEYAELLVVREEPDGIHEYRIYIVYDSDGLWRIHEM